MSALIDRIDPELAEALAAVPKTPAGIFDLTDIEGTRAAIHVMAQEADTAGPNETDIAVEVHHASRPERPSLGLRLFRPVDGPATLPAVLWFHGGGQVLGFAAQEDALLKRMARAVGCAVVAVDYRLAPEAPAPAAAEDGYFAYNWLRREAQSLGIDAARIGIAGASGGGCIAAAAVLMIRDRGEPLPLFQALNYPMLDDRNETLSSRVITDIGVWDRHNNILAWKPVLGDRAGSDNVSPYAAPARALDLSGLPPTFMAVGELDLLLDEDLAYATRAMASGVPAELHVYPGAYHAWDLFAPASRLASRFMQSWYSYLTRQFHN